MTRTRSAARRVVILLLGLLLLAPAPARAGVTDLVADRLEVTQATQDLNNSVMLVKGKRTFVRFHVHATLPGIHGATARLCASLFLGDLCVSPLNPGARINVPVTPNRASLNDAFLFELPSFLTTLGSLSLTAEVNPPTDSPFRLSPTSAIEIDRSNNKASQVVSFQTVPMQQIVSVSVPYTLDGATHTPAVNHHLALHRWIKAAYPIPDLLTTVKTMVPTYTGQRAFDAKGRPFLQFPDCGTINARLWLGAAFDALVGPPWQYPRKYYGLVSDEGEFMRGCVTEIPDLMGSGPTGVPDPTDWDTDGSFGDWYAGHELGHAYGRGHANFCDAVDGPSYPYPQGRISPTTTGNAAIYGIRPDVPNAPQGWEIYPPWWTDVMTYCPFEWMSDFTYEGLLDLIQDYQIGGSAFNGGGGPAGPPLSEGPGALLVAAIVDPKTGSAKMLPTYALAGGWDVEPVESGYTIVQRRAFTRAVERQPILAIEMGPGAPQPGGEAAGEHALFLRGLVPLQSDTNRIELEGPNGEILATVSAGLAAPSVTVTKPVAGAMLAGNLIKVAWTAADPDGDPLRYNVEYSTDNGQTWQVVAQDLTAKTVNIPRGNLVASDRARFRVRASDGINTTTARSGTFTLTNKKPTVQITAPDRGTVVLTDQTLGLAADAYDVDGGTMTGPQVRWTSSRDGHLGHGGTLSVTGLHAGAHTITVTADDGMGGVATDTVAVNVVSDPDDLPPVPDALTAGPEVVLLDPAAGLRRHQITIANQNPERPLTVWVAVSSVRWLRVGTLQDALPGTSAVSVQNDVSVEAGVTPGVVTISAGNTSGMAAGTYRADVVVTAPGFDRLTIPVTLRVGEP